MTTAKKTSAQAASSLREKLSYDPQPLRTSEYQRIVHIGLGQFPRGHVLHYIHELNDRILSGKASDADEKLCSVHAVSLRDTPAERTVIDALKAQDFLYSVFERDIDGDTATVIGSLGDFGLYCENEEACLSCAASSSAQIISVTATEKGYCFNKTCGELSLNNADLIHDLAGGEPPRTVYGLLERLLAKRKEMNCGPVTVLSCDNIPQNGAILGKLLRQYLKERNRDLGKWAEDAVFTPSSMVDSITPRFDAAVATELCAKFGICDDAPVVREKFRQWVIEDVFPAGRPALEMVGVQFVKDVHPYESMKLHLLNGSHTSMVYLGVLAGFEYVHEIIANDLFAAFISRFMDQEVTPALSPVPGIDLSDYKKQLLRRFSNPAIADRALRICSDGSAKFPDRILPILRKQLGGDGHISMMSLAIAGWIKFLAGLRTNRDIPGFRDLFSDPMAEELSILAESVGTDAGKFVKGASSVFRQDLAESKVFHARLEDALTGLYERGALATIERFCSEPK